MPGVGRRGAPPPVLGRELGEAVEVEVRLVPPHPAHRRGRLLARRRAVGGGELREERERGDDGGAERRHGLAEAAQGPEVPAGPWRPSGGASRRRRRRPSRVPREEPRRPPAARAPRRPTAVAPPPRRPAGARRRGGPARRRRARHRRVSASSVIGSSARLGEQDERWLVPRLVRGVAAPCGAEEVERGEATLPRDEHRREGRRAGPPGAAPLGAPLGRERHGVARPGERLAEGPEHRGEGLVARTPPLAGGARELDGDAAAPGEPLERLPALLGGPGGPHAQAVVRPGSASRSRSPRSGRWTHSGRLASS